VPATKEPTSLSRSDGGRPDGMTLIPWQNGKALTWDVCGNNTGRLLYQRISKVSGCSGGVGSHEENHQILQPPCGVHMFQPIALETLGAINSSAGEFLADLGRKISGISGERAFYFSAAFLSSAVIQRDHSA